MVRIKVQVQVFLTPRHVLSPPCCVILHDRTKNISPFFGATLLFILVYFIVVKLTHNVILVSDVLLLT